MNTYRIQDFDPCAVTVSEETIAKYSHLMEEKQRVRIIADGRVGVLETIGHGGRYFVRLDSSHAVVCREHELEPESFPAAQPAPAKANMMTPAQFDGLQRKVALGELDEVDAHRVKKALANPSVLDPFSPETDADRVLTAMVKKHLGTSAAVDTLTKAAGRSAFKVGDRFTDRWGECGKITGLDEGRVDVVYDSGIYGTVLQSHIKAA